MSQKQRWIWPLYPLKPGHWGNRLWTDDGTPPGQAVEVSIMSVYQRALPGGPPEKSHKSIEKFYIPTDDDLALMRQCYPQNDPQEPDWVRIKADLVALMHSKATLERSTAPAVLHKLREAFCCQLRQVNLPPRDVKTINIPGNSWTLPKVIEAVKSIRDLASELQILETSECAKSRIERMTRITAPDPTSEYALAAAQHILIGDGQTAFLEVLSVCGVLFKYGAKFSGGYLDPKRPFDSNGVKKAARDLTHVCDQWLKMMGLEAAKTSPPAVDIPGKGMAWQKAMRLAENHSKRNPYPGVEALAKLVGCSTGTISKAINNSLKLRAWRAKHRVKPKSVSTLAMSEIIMDSAKQSREPDPSDAASVKVDEAFARLLEEAKPEERKKMGAMTPAKKAELVRILENDPDRL